MRQIHSESIPKAPSEVIVAITEDELLFAVDALQARASEIDRRELRAWTIEGEEINGRRVSVLDRLKDGYTYLAGKLILYSDVSWKSSDNRNPEKELYELAEKRLSADVTAHTAAQEVREIIQDLEATSIA